MSIVRYITEYRTFAQIRPLLNLECISLICGSHDIPDELRRSELLAHAHRLYWTEQQKWYRVVPDAHFYD